MPSILWSSFFPSVKWVALMLFTSVLFLTGVCLTSEDLRLLVILQHLGHGGDGQGPRINGDGALGAILAFPVLTGEESKSPVHPTAHESGLLAVGEDLWESHCRFLGR